MTVRIALDLDNTPEDKAEVIDILGGAATPEQEPVDVAALIRAELAPLLEKKSETPVTNLARPLDRMAFAVLNCCEADLDTIPGLGKGLINKLQRWAGERLHGPSEEVKELEELAAKTREEDAEKDEPGQLDPRDQMKEDEEYDVAKEEEPIGRQDVAEKLTELTSLKGREVALNVLHRWAPKLKEVPDDELPNVYKLLSFHIENSDDDEPPF